jgi:hypothetical protein
MRSVAALSFVLTLLFSLAAAQIDKQIDISAWPLSASKSQTLAKLSYNSETATVLSYKVPALPAGEEIVRIGFHHPTTGSWSGIATAASNFADGKDKKLQLLLNEQGDVYHVGFKSLDIPSSSKGGSKKDDMSVEVVPMKAGATVHLNKPILLTAEGKVEGAPEEKTFLQKYVQSRSISRFMTMLTLSTGTGGPLAFSWCSRSPWAAVERSSLRQIQDTRRSYDNQMDILSHYPTTKKSPVTNWN